MSTRVAGLTGVTLQEAPRICHECVWWQSESGRSADKSRRFSFPGLATAVDLFIDIIEPDGVGAILLQPLHKRSSAIAGVAVSLQHRVSPRAHS